MWSVFSEAREAGAHMQLDFHNHRQGHQEMGTEFVVALCEILPDCKFDAAHQREHLTMQVLTSCHLDDAHKCMLLEEQIDLDKC